MKKLNSNIFNNYFDKRKLRSIMMKPNGLSIAKSDMIKPVKHNKKYLDETIFLKRSGKKLDDNVLTFQCSPKL